MKRTGFFIGGILLLAMGYGAAFLLPKVFAEEVKKLESLPYIRSAGELGKAKIGARAILEGNISRRSATVVRNLVVACEEKYEKVRERYYRDGRTRYRRVWKWVLQRKYIRPFWLNLSTGLDIYVDLQDKLQDQCPGGQVTRVRQHDTKRYVGLRRGDRVVVVGTLQAGRRILADRYLGGTRTSLLEVEKSGGKIVFWVGIALLVCGVISLGAGVLRR